jgi:hypothetical protein
MSKVSVFLFSAIVALTLIGCSSPTRNVYVPAAPPSINTPASTPPSMSTLARVNNQVISGGQFIVFPTSGTYVKAGHTLSLSWAADGNLECFILTENQHNNFKRLGIASAWMAYGQGTGGGINAYIQNDDTYYGIVRNTFTLGSSVKVYQAVLIQQ